VRTISIDARSRIGAKWIVTAGSQLHPSDPEEAVGAFYADCLFASCAMLGRRRRPSLSAAAGKRQLAKLLLLNEFGGYRTEALYDLVG
jgi:hypothetical protein